MKWQNMVKFVLLSVAVFLLTLGITHIAAIGNAIKAFPIDRLVSYLLGGLTMFLATHKFKRKKKNEETQ